MRKKKIVKRVVTFLIILFIGFIIFSSIHNENELSKYGVKTTAKIIEVQGGNKGERNVKFQFVVNKTRFESTDQIPFLILLPCEKSNMGCIGEPIDIIYSSENPEINKILLE